MTAFSDEEQVEFGIATDAPWLLVDTLRKSGAIYEKARNWGVFIFQGRQSPDGSEPRTTAALADAVVAALR